MMIMAIVIWDNIVTGEVDGVGARNLEENALVLGNGDVERLLVVLYTC